MQVCSRKAVDGSWKEPREAEELPAVTAGPSKPSVDARFQK